MIAHQTPQTAAEVRALALLVARRKRARDMPQVQHCAITLNTRTKNKKVLATGPRARRIYALPAGPWLEGREPAQDKFKLRHILQAVAFKSGVSRDDLTSEKRNKHIVRPRQIAFYLMREMGRPRPGTEKVSLPEIGREFGDRDHTTILHGVRAVEALLKAGNEQTVTTVSEVKETLRNSTFLIGGSDANG